MIIEWTPLSDRLFLVLVNRVLGDVSVNWRRWVSTPWGPVGPTFLTLLSLFFLLKANLH